MNIRWLDDIESFTAGDATQIKEVLHPKNEPLDLPYSLAHATLKPGESSLPHILANRVEVYVFTAGEGVVHIGGESQNVSNGAIVLIPAGVKQYVVNNGSSTLAFYCLVSPPWQKADEYVEKGQVE